MTAADPVRAIADAILYEGYLLWPYRRSALKNRQRWTFGGVYPRGHSEGREDDPWRLQAQVLVEGGPEATVEVGARFLQVVRREVSRRTPTGFEPVDELTVGGERHLSWEEAVEREAALPPRALRELAAAPESVPISVAAGSRAEELGEEGAVVRRWEALEGSLRVAAEQLREGLQRLTVTIENTAPWGGGQRAAALKRTFCSTHAVLRCAGGEFVSLADPPAGLAPEAAQCRNEGLWPVLAGPAGDRRTVLASPIILEDHPRIAPESPGDLFDGGEIDQLLVLNILSLTDEEKAEMRAGDPRAREILERTEALSEEQLMSLHGTVREWAGTPWEELERPAPGAVEVGGVTVRRGSRVRLRPRPGGDVFDGALAGRVALVEAIEQDMEGALKLAVVVEDDPGRDLGYQRRPGHRFFFAPEEVEALGEAAAAAKPAKPVLVAGIGNVLLGDDGFGVALANRLAACELPPGVEVTDFGIRGIDLAWAMQDGWDAVVLLDATPRGGPPGTLYLIEPEVEVGARPVEGHAMDPATVLALVGALGGEPPRTLVVGCEPLTRIDPDAADLVADLSEPVRLALDEGMEMVRSVLAELTAENEERSPPWATRQSRG